MKNDMNQVLIEATVRRTLKNIRESPKREIRNLVDFGLEFSKGRFQKNFLQVTQKMLYNQDSAYYSLVKNIVDSVDTDILTTFGINLGYNGCTKGAEVIREIEAERGFNVPWSLTIAVNEQKLDEEPDFYTDLLCQGISLGINTYLLFVTGNPEKVIPLMQHQPECAFILFLRGHQINDIFIEKMKPLKNVMLSIYDNEDMLEACQKLRNARMLYSVYLRYTKKDKERILSGEWLNSVMSAQPAFAILRTDECESIKLQQDIYIYVISIRIEQRYPLIPIDLRHDALLIDHIISDDECLVGFDADGNLRTYGGVNCEKGYNIFHNSLEEILQKAFRKFTE